MHRSFVSRGEMYNPLHNVEAGCYECDEPLTPDRHVVGILGEGEVRPRAYFCSNVCYTAYTRPENISRINDEILRECNIVGEERDKLLRDAETGEPQLVYVRRVNLTTTSLSKEDMGRGNWVSFHSFGTALPEEQWEDEEELRLLRNYVESFVGLYPCYECRSHAKAHIKKRPPDYSSPRAFRQWQCDLHNDVNVMLKKPVVPCINIQSQIGTRFFCAGHGHGHHDHRRRQ